MRPHTVWTLLVLTLLASGASAIYEDQAGQYDWLKQNVGRVSLALLAPRPRPRLVVASEAGVVAALSPRDGSLLWRRVLPEGTGAPSHMELAGNRVLTLSDGGRLLEAMDVDSGRLLWAQELWAAGEEAPGAVPGAALLGSGADARVAVVLGGSLRVFATDSGRQLGGDELAEGTAQTVLAGEGGQAWSASLLGPGGLAVAGLAPDGSVVQRVRLSSPAALRANGLAISSAGVAALSADGAQLCSGGVGGDGALACRPLAGLLPGGASAAGAALRGGPAGRLTLQTDGGAALLQLAGGHAKLVHFAPGATASVPVPTEGDGDALLGLATPSPQGLRLAVLSAADGSELAAGVVAGLRPTRVDGSLVGVDRLFLARWKKADGAALRLLAVLADGDLALAPPADAPAPAWLRHEGLAELLDVLFADLPAPTPEIEAQWLAARPGPGAALRAQLLALKRQLGLATPEEAAAVAAHKAAASDRLRPTRDPDGFRKQLLVLTRGGRLAALHNGDGRLLWSADLGGGARAGELPRKLALWRVPHRAGQDLEVVALSSTHAWVVNAHTGAVGAPLALPGGPATELLQLPAPAHEDGADQHAFVAVPAAGGAPGLLPDTPAARAAFEAARPGLSFWRLDAEGGALTGHGFGPDGSVQERWRVVAAPPGGPYRVVAAVGQARGEAVYTFARVTGTGDLKFKYLDPNKILVLVGLPDGAPRSAAPGGRPRLTALVLDGVSGRVLASAVHKDARGPAHAVLSENLAAYHYLSLSASRWQVSSIELFDAAPKELRLLDLAFSETNDSASSWDATPLEVRSASFFTKLPVSALGLTRTARGVTAKQLLLGTPGGQVYMMDRRFVDPARPRLAPGQKQPTPAQAAEGLPVFSPELPLVGASFATLDRRAARLRGIATEPAVLESTSLMAAWGLDLFYTRVQPSRQFDMVPDDFPFALLTLVVVGLSAASVVLRRVSSARMLQRMWA